MDHVAIMNKSWGLIPKILSGSKTIESRWYKTKRTPWDKIAKGDTVYFKNSGEQVVEVRSDIHRIDWFPAQIVSNKSIARGHHFVFRTRTHEDNCCFVAQTLLLDRLA